MPEQPGREPLRRIERARRRPGDPDGWLALASAAARAGTTLAGVVGPGDLDGLLTLWAAYPRCREVGTLVLPALGLVPAAGEDGGYERLSGLPRRTRRARDGASMVLVPAGSFRRGSAANTIREGPVRTVRLSAFYADVHPVTVARYQAFLPTGAVEAPPDWDEQAAGPDRPVVQVGWREAAAYAAWAGGRLPTEAEWEKLARGEAGAAYPWGDDPTGALGPGEGSWSRGLDLWTRELLPVGAYPWTASPYGAHDLAGMVREWCHDWFRDGYYETAPEADPPGPADGGAKALRGGSWQYPAWLATASQRFGDVPGMRSTGYGFRVVVPVGAGGRRIGAGPGEGG